MSSRFKFLSTIDPNAVPPNQIKSRFNKLTLSTTNTSKMETTVQKDAIHAEIATATIPTKAEQNENGNIPERVVSKVSTSTNSGQKPKILMYESMMTSKSDTSLNEHGNDLLTDDDTNSVGSSIDADFLHTIDTNNDPKTKNSQKLDSSNISTSEMEQRTTQSNTVDEVLNMSHQFSGMDLMQKNESAMDETVQNCSPLTLSSTYSSENSNKSKAMSDDGRNSNIIVLSDSDDESKDQPPLKIVPALMEDYNVSSSLPGDAVGNLPSSSLMHKINKFFDNVPSLNASLNETVFSSHMENSHGHENESIYVSETTCDDDASESGSHSNHGTSIDDVNRSPVHNDAVTNVDLLECSSASVVPATCNVAIEDELVGVSEVGNVPVTKSSSDQAPVVKTQSGIKLTTTNSTPIIESTVLSAEGVKRSNSNIPSAKKTGGSFKFNAGSNGQLNIAAKININIQISNEDTSSSEESSPDVSMKDDASLETPAIESEPFEENAETDETEENRVNKSSSDNSTTSLPATQTHSVASSPYQQSQAKPGHSCDTPKTPSAISKIKSFEFVTPKSMTKVNNTSSYKTPKRKTVAQHNKVNALPEILPDGFEVDQSIEVDPMDQLLLHQVYGDAWKTPELLRCHSAVKGRPVTTQTMRVVQSAQPSNQFRVSRGFNVFKRNIADDLDSTRWDELSIIEGPAAHEISSLKNQDARRPQVQPPIRKEPSMIAEENEKPSPKVMVKQRHVKKSFLATDEEDFEYTNEKICPPPPPPTSIKKNTKSKRFQTLQTDCSQSLLRRDKDIKTSVVQKRNPPRKPAQVAKDRVRKICDSENESEDGGETDEFMTSDEDDDWDAKKDASSSSTSSSSDDEFVPRTARKRGQVVGATSTTRKKAAANRQKLVYLDLSSEEVVEVKENHQSNVSEEDLAELTRKFLESDLNDSHEEKKPVKLLRRKLFTPNYDALEDDTTLNEHFQSDERTAKPQNKPNENDEVKLKMPIPIFTSLIDSKGFATPKESAPKAKAGDRVNAIDTPTEGPQFATKDTTYSFLYSLDVLALMRLCHPDAVKFKKNFNENKEELGEILCKLYNDKIFDGKLKTPISWNNKLPTTAVRCCQRKTKDSRTARIELSTKEVTSADRLRCTLIHEMCHAAVWIFDGENGGHGVKWKAWANRSNEVFPELPPIIARCHNYEFEYKYMYQCDLCNSKSFSYSKSKNLENIRCSYCHGSISVYLNKKQKDGKIVPTPSRAPSGFAKFVKEKYKQFKEPDIKHAEVMKLISDAFGSLSVEEKKKYR